MLCRSRSEATRQLSPCPYEKNAIHPGPSELLKEAHRVNFSRDVPSVPHSQPKSLKESLSIFRQFHERDALFGRHVTSEKGPPSVKAETNASALLWLRAGEEVPHKEHYSQPAWPLTLTQGRTAPPFCLA